MDAGGGGGQGLANSGGHALANGAGGHANGLVEHALANGGGPALANGLANGGGGHALANGEGYALANGLANGGGGHAPANQALANGGGHALANGGDQPAAMEAGGAVGNGGLQVMAAPNGVVPAQAALHLAFLRLPAQEIARCRRVCRLWRDITSTEAFRSAHHDHSSRTPMPLISFFLYPGPGLGRFHIHSVDFRNLVTRLVIRYPLHDQHHEAWRIHGSCAGLLLLSCGDRLYACNPCTRRWAHLPPLHVTNDIIGFYATGVYGVGGFGFQVLYHDRRLPYCEYWIFELGVAAPTSIGRPGPIQGMLQLVLANGIAPSHAFPPVYVDVYLCWLPQAGLANIDVLMFDTEGRSFRLIPPPTIQVNGEDVLVGVVGAQLLEIGGRVAMTVISQARVDVWVRDNVTELWERLYRIPRHQVNGAFPPGVFAVAQDISGRLRCPHIMLAGHGIFLARHTIQESLLLHPSILPLGDEDSVDGDPPFFQN